MNLWVPYQIKIGNSPRPVEAWLEIKLLRYHGVEEETSARLDINKNIIKAHDLQVSRGGVSRWIVQSGGGGGANDKLHFLHFQGLSWRTDWSGVLAFQQLLQEMDSHKP